jgi:hypothetical protein
MDSNDATIIWSSTQGQQIVYQLVEGEQHANIMLGDLHQNRIIIDTDVYPFLFYNSVADICVTISINREIIIYVENDRYVFDGVTLRN